MSAVLLSDIGDVYTGAGPDVLAYTLCLMSSERYCKFACTRIHNKSFCLDYGGFCVHRRIGGAPPCRGRLRDLASLKYYYNEQSQGILTLGRS